MNLCQRCDGSGEGLYEGQRCESCWGSGCEGYKQWWQEQQDERDEQAYEDWKDRRIYRDE